MKQQIDIAPSQGLRLYIQAFVKARYNKSTSSMRRHCFTAGVVVEQGVSDHCIIGMLNYWEVKYGFGAEAALAAKRCNTCQVDPEGTGQV